MGRSVHANAGRCQRFGAGVAAQVVFPTASRIFV